ncbi:hypothetical protein [Pandoraea morbifera]|uniref:hypothetical protein n=1 Tax=Pandoraea morbifera TaxID=2508300 RepID=UPI001242D103|nr:hypothetical protein [Pandoraea morbifera]
MSDTSGGGADAKAMNSQHLQMMIAIILSPLGYPGFVAGSDLTIVRRYRGGNSQSFRKATAATFESPAMLSVL